MVRTGVSSSSSSTCWRAQMRETVCWRVLASGSRMQDPSSASSTTMRPSQSSRKSRPTWMMLGMRLARAIIAAWLRLLPSDVMMPKIIPEGMLNRSLGISLSAARMTGWSSVSRTRGRPARMFTTRWVTSRISTLRSCR